MGYMGHITRVSNTIVEFAKRNQQLDDYMKANEQWMEFIGEALKLENEQSFNEQMVSRCKLDSRNTPLEVFEH